ncbi:MAG: aminoglycoside phosphotransferase family protein [Acidimicrobiia bacterium]|nr:aminoglycoside phosphotransferase family protein [Acidimicrobiia bacterium]
MLMNTPVQISTETGFAHDPALPTRDLVLDTNHMREEFCEVFDTSFETCERVRTKYRVSESLRATYRLEAEGAETIVSLRCHAIGSSPGPSHSAKRLPRFNALAWTFPDDRKLDTLRHFVHEQALRGRVAGLVIDEIERVSYAPEKAATFRCFHDGRTIGYAKIYRDDDHRLSADKYRHLQPLLLANGVRAPELIWTDDTLRQVMISPVAGSTIAERYEAGDWHLLGVGLARLHRIPAPEFLGPFQRVARGWLKTAIEVIGAARPDVRELLDELGSVLEETRVTNVGLPSVLLHGDVHAKNVLIDERGQLGFIDLDQASSGPAMAELGSLVAALRLDTSLDTAQRADAERQLLAGYTQEDSDLYSPSLAWHIAAAIVGERLLRAVNRVRIETLRDLSGPIESALHTIEATRI